MPIGSRPYEPKAEAFKGAYRHFSLPPGFAISLEKRVYYDRVLLDQDLHSILLRAARHALEPPQATGRGARDVRKAEEYLNQLTRIPGLTVRQREEATELLRVLRYHQARASFDNSVFELKRARDWFAIAAQPPEVSSDAQEYQRKVERALHQLTVAAPSDDPSPVVEIHLPDSKDQDIKPPSASVSVSVATTTTSTGSERPIRDPSRP